MIVTVCSIALVLIFISISFLHIYWAAGGRWAIDSVVPTNEQGERMLKTGVASCLVVAVGLLMFATYYLAQARFIQVELPVIISNTGGWIISSIFLLRAIGDFKYVGFTKKIKNTTFARLDTAYFAWLCLLIAVLGILVKVFS
jgi:hypothetical protein